PVNVVTSINFAVSCEVPHKAIRPVGITECVPALQQPVSRFLFFFVTNRPASIQIELQPDKVVPGPTNINGGWRAAGTINPKEIGRVIALPQAARAKYATVFRVTGRELEAQLLLDLRDLRLRANQFALSRDGQRRQQCLPL